MEQQPLVMNGGTDVVLEEPADFNPPLSEVVDNFQRGIWIKPDHQRDFVWDDDKVQAWLDRIALAVRDRARKPVGVIVTYQIADGKPSPIYINDGSQRVQATLHGLLNPEKFGYSREKIEQIVRALRIPVQHRHYADQDAALQDFQLLNMGTALTPREMCKGILSNAPSYPLWGPMLERVHSLMRTVGGGLVEMPSDNRKQRHKWERHDFAMLVRWLSNEPLADFRGVGAAELTKRQIDDGRIIESVLRDHCSQKDPEELRRQVDMFVSHVHRQVALYREVWSGLQLPHGTAISPTLFRWTVDISIWARKTQVPQTKWEEFVRLLLAHTKGVSVVQHPENTRTRVTLALGSAGKLKSVCSIIGSDMYEGRDARKRNRGPRLPGYDESHIAPFVTDGNGPTVLEPASRNRARGARPIEP